MLSRASPEGGKKKVLRLSSSIFPYVKPLMTLTTAFPVSWYEVAVRHELRDGRENSKQQGRGLDRTPFPG